MISEKRVDTLKPGNIFRDWLIDTLGDRIRNKGCDVIVYLIGPASHTVCRYEFIGENYSVIAKFYAEQKGAIKNYDPVRSMNTKTQGQACGNKSGSKEGRKRCCELLVL